LLQKPFNSILSEEKPPKQVRLEEKLLKSSRLYATISHVNKTIVYARDAGELFKKICSVAVEFGKFRMAWIGLIDKESRLVVPVTHYGHEEGYLSRIRISLDTVAEGMGPTGNAIRQGKPFICNNIKSDPAMLAWRKEALQREYQSSIALPITKFGEPFGSFSLYSQDANFFDQDEVDLLKEVVKDVSFALEKFDNEAALQETERLLKESEARYRKAQVIGRMGHWELTVRNVEINWSDEVYSIFGIEKDDSIITFKTFLTFVHPADKTIFMKAEEEIISGKNQLDLVYRIILKDGSIKQLHQLGKIVYGPDGELLALTGTVQDITEQEQKEQEIQERNEQLRELASNLQNIREEERTYIAREIHDELGQQLTAIKLDVSWLDRKTPDVGPVKQRIGSILSMLTDVLHSIRRISTQLRPSVLDDLGLIEALKWQVQDFETRYKIPVNFDCPEDFVLTDAGMTTGLFRIFQETLTNIARHSDATAVTASLRINGGQLLLTISDNGKGFDREEVKKKKTLGLLGMKERTLMMNGQCEIDTTPGKGTSLSVSIPLTTPEIKEDAYLNSR
jgi:PAS domain S-box-containing protein